MEKYIVELLRKHECVVIPNFGGFLTTQAHARIHQDTRQFFPPSKNVVFNSILSENDGLMAHHISQSENISYNEALSRLKSWVDGCQKKLDAGEMVRISQVGDFTLNSEGNLQFVADPESNFLDSSFGLPVFIPKKYISALPVLDEEMEEEQPVVEQPVEVKVKKPVKEKVEKPVKEKIKKAPKEKVVFKVKKERRPFRFLNKETVKWAAVLIPFAALVIWGNINSKKINQVITSYSSIISWAYPDPAQTPSANVYPLEHRDTTFARSKIDVARIAYGAIHAYALDTTPGKPQQSVFPHVQLGNFHVIGGSFRDYKNAENLVIFLKTRGLSAEIVERNQSGLYLVSIFSTPDRNAATTFLDSIHKGLPKAWIHKKSF